MNKAKPLLKLMTVILLHNVALLNPPQRVLLILTTPQALISLDT